MTHKWLVGANAMLRSLGAGTGGRDRQSAQRPNEEAPWTRRCRHIACAPPNDERTPLLARPRRADGRVLQLKSHRARRIAGTLREEIKARPHIRCDVCRHQFSFSPQGHTRCLQPMRGLQENVRHPFEVAMCCLPDSYLRFHRPCRGALAFAADSAEAGHALQTRRFGQIAQRSQRGVERDAQLLGGSATAIDPIGPEPEGFRAGSIPKIR
jgi:hypothetical protein